MEGFLLGKIDNDRKNVLYITDDLYKYWVLVFLQCLNLYATILGCRFMVLARVKQPHDIPQP